MKKQTVLFLFIFFNIHIYAQEVNDTITLEEIIVLPSPFSNYVYNDNAFGNLHWAVTAKNLKKTAFLNESLSNAASVHVNDGTTNPIGQDVQIRGFHASPLYGLSQEIAIYADGVKQNDLLGDAVFWDLMPTFAMNQAQIFVGSQPIFGLNALGGTVNYSSKSGFTNPEKTIALSYGSFNRLNALVEYGNQHKNFAWYIGSNFWKETGWRDFSNSKTANTFAKLSYAKNKHQLDISGQYANSNLLGNGALPLELLKRSEWRNQVFTHPDRTENQLFAINFNWIHEFSKQTKGRLILGYKNIQTGIINGDESPFSIFSENGQSFLILGEDDDDNEEEEEEEEISPSDFAQDINGDRILATEQNSEAILNQNKVRQKSISAAYALDTKWQTSNISWNWQTGLSFRGGEAQYIAGGELGSFDNTRAVQSSGARVTNFDTDVITKVKNVHFTSGLNALLNNNFAIQLSGAYNHSNLDLEDQIGTELNGSHRFSNFSGALGFYYLIRKNWMIHGTINTTTRNPTAVEVSCADPDAPCRLPNAFLSDPPLETVRASTLQLGWNYQDNRLKLGMTVFRTRVTNDIYFVSAGPFRGAGFFDNIGNTQRIGWENTFSINWTKQLKTTINYTLLKATFQDAFTISSPNHPNEMNGEIAVEKDDHIALIPNHNLQGQLFYSINNKFSLEWTIRFNSTQYIRGDEANLLQPLEGYWRNDATLDYSLNKNIQLWLSIKNLTNAQYQTFGLLGEGDEASELLGEELESNVFAGPAAPRYLELGFRYQF